MKKIATILGPAVFLFVLLFFKPEGLSQSVIAVIAVTIWSQFGGFLK